MSLKEREREKEKKKKFKLIFLLLCLGWRRLIKPARRLVRSLTHSLAGWPAGLARSIQSFKESELIIKFSLIIIPSPCALYSLFLFLSLSC